MIHPMWSQHNTEVGDRTDPTAQIQRRLFKRAEFWARRVHGAETALPVSHANGWRYFSWCVALILTLCTAAPSVGRRRFFRFTSDNACTYPNTRLNLAQDCRVWRSLPWGAWVGSASGECCAPASDELLGTVRVLNAWLAGRRNKRGNSRQGRALSSGGWQELPRRSPSTKVLSSPRGQKSWTVQWIEAHCSARSSSSSLGWFLCTAGATTSWKATLAQGSVNSTVIHFIACSSMSIVEMFMKRGFKHYIAGFRWHGL